MKLPYWVVTWIHSHITELSFEIYNLKSLNKIKVAKGTDGRWWIL